MVFSDAFDANYKMMSPHNIKKFFRSLIVDLQPIETGFDLSSSSNIIVCNLLLVPKIGKPNLEILSNGFMARASEAVRRSLVVAS